MSKSKRNSPNDRSLCVRAQHLGIEYRSGWLGRHRVRAVEDVSFEAPTGSLTAIVGANGSGKSSVLRALLALERPTQGDIRVLDDAPGSASLRGRIGVVLEGRLPLGRLTGQEYLSLAAAIAGLDRRAADERARHLLDELGLREAAERAHGRWSTGMERRLAFAEALVHQPDLLVLDEPGSGLDPVALGIMREALERHRSGGKSAILATHALDALGADLFDQVLVLDQGRLVARGTPEDVLTRDDVYEFEWAHLDADARERMQRLAIDAGAQLVRQGRARLRLAELLRRSHDARGDDS